MKTDFNYQADAVTSESTEYQRWMDISSLTRSIMGGTRAMREAGTAFLPKNPMESSASYDNRLAMSVLFNVFSKTVTYLSGHVFRKDFVWAESVPADFLELIKNVDTQRNDINVFMRRIFEHGLAHGVAHIFIDAPKVSTDRVLSMAEEKAGGIRPFMRLLDPTDVIGWIVNEEGRLKQVRFREYVPVRNGEYGFDTERRIRVYNADGTWQVWLDEKGKGATQSPTSATLLEEGQLSYKGIPIVPFIPGKEMTILTGESPLQDLADLNCAHWQSYSDQRNILNVARVPILFGRHIEVKKMPVGTATMVVSDDDNSDLKFVEVTGAAINSGKEDLKDLEHRMALWGLQQLIPRTGTQTATEKALTTKENNSALSTWATEFEHCLQEACEIFQAMRGQAFPAEGVTVNKEFTLGYGVQEDVASLAMLKKEGAISDRTLFEEAKKRGLVSESIEWEDITAEKEESQRNAPDPLAGLFGGQPSPQKNTDE